MTSFCKMYGSSVKDLTTNPILDSEIILRSQKMYLVLDFRLLSIVYCSLEMADGGTKLSLSSSRATAS